MKKIYLSALLALGIVGGAFAQESAGGFPMSSKMVKVQNQEVAHIDLPRPDYEAIMKDNNEKESKGVARPYMVATLVTSDISLSNSGSWSYLDDGSKIWRLTVSVPEAKGIGLYFDDFKLPKGVKLFVSDKAGRQVLGAFTAANNDEDFGKFATAPVAGAYANIELDIPANVAAKEIAFHINEVAAYYRGMGGFELTTGSDVAPAKPTGVVVDGSAPCHIDANCPLPPTADREYEIQKNASVKIIIRSESGMALGYCSGTLINNTGNSANGTCKPLLLTASHCDGDNSFDDTHFAQWLFIFNYRYDSCGGNEISSPTALNTMIGADFRARSYYPSMSTPAGANPRLVGDFLLLELKSQPDADLGTYLAGWNRNIDLSLNTDYYNFFIGYHYPGGNPEKYSVGYTVDPTGTFNQNQVSATHWGISFVRGGSEGGSSGSALFDVDGRIIGDLSGGPESGCNNLPQFAKFGNYCDYSKISYNWDNDYDQNNHPRPAGQEKQSRLKDWLDPGNTGAYTTDAVMPDCTPTGIHDRNEEMGNNIEIFPSPSTTGIVKAKTKFNKPVDLKVGVYNALGQLVKSFSINAAFNGVYSFNCSELANGMYIIKFVGKDAMTSKKVLIAR